MKLKKAAKKLAKTIEAHYQCHGIYVKLQPIHYVRETERFIFQVIPRPGTKIGLIFDRADDIGTAIQMPIFHPFRDGVRIYLAVSSENVSENSLQKMLSSQMFLRSDSDLPIALGYNLMGAMVFEDLAAMPHALYAGTTQSGKSTGLVSLILSLVCKRTADKLNLVIFDIGAFSMKMFEGLPHLSYPIVKNQSEALHVLLQLNTEMERRIDLSDEERKSIAPIVCIIDEYVSFIQDVKDVQHCQMIKDSITQMLRRGRKAKIHLVLATQDIRSNSMGVDTNNITSRMVFKVAKYQTSINALNVGGAEKLPGNGAMLHISTKYPDPTYIQGALMPDDEMKNLLLRVCELNSGHKTEFCIPEFEGDEELETITSLISSKGIDKSKDQELAKIIVWVLGNSKISVKQIKERFSIGNRANDIMDKLFSLGLVGDKNANLPRQVLIKKPQDLSAESVKLLEENGYPLEDVFSALEKVTEIPLE